MTLKTIEKTQVFELEKRAAIEGNSGLSLFTVCQHLLAIVLLFISFQVDVSAVPSGYYGRSGEPGAGRCSDCHGSAGNYAAFTYLSDYSPYVGQKVNIQIKLNNSSTSTRQFSGGFNIAPASGNIYTRNSGTAANTARSSGVNELKHTSPKNTTYSPGNSTHGDVSWGTTSADDIYWYAPSKGSYSIYLCANAANHSSGSALADIGGDNSDCHLRSGTVYNRPTISGFDDTNAYTEGFTTTIDNDLVLTDDSSLSTNRATIEIYLGYVSGQDTFVCPSTTLTCGISGNTLTLSGTASTTTYDAALQAVRYNNTSQNPSTATRSFRVRIRDTANNYSGYDYTSKAVIAVNDDPTSANFTNTLSYQEGNGAVTLDSNVTLADPENNTVENIVLYLTAFQTGDTLSCASDANFNCAWDGSRTLTISSSTATKRTLALYQTKLRTVSYSTSREDRPTGLTSNASRVRMIVTDTGGTANGGDPTSLSYYKYISFTGVNDDPTSSGFTNDLAYQEGSGAVFLDNNVTLADQENDTLENIVLSFSNIQTGDTLSCNSDVNFKCTWDGSTTLTIGSSSGAKRSLAQYQAKLQTVTYLTNRDDRATQNNASRVRMIITDTGGTANGGDVTSIAYYKYIDFTAVNDPPVITGFTGSQGYLEHATDFVGAVINITDQENNNISSATVRITNFVAAEDVLACVSGSGITCSWNGVSGVLSLTGSTSIANYVSKLRSVTYNNSSPAPTTTSRNLQLDVTDVGGVANGGDNTATTASKNINITARNDAPVITGFAGITAYTENVTVVVDSLISVSDDENNTIASASMTITNVVSAEDSLNCSSGSGIVCSWNGGSGVLTLSGTAALSTYKAKLESVTYSNSSQDPVATTRNIKLVLSDTGGTANSGVDTSTPVSKSIAIASVNAPPLVTGFSGMAPYTENTTIVLNAAITITDEENHTVSSATLSINNFVAGEDVLACNSDVNIVCSWNAATGVLTLSGITSLANYEARIESVTYNNVSNNPTTTTRMVVLVLTDTGGTANGGNDTSSPVNKGVAITAVNDQPVVAGFTGTASYFENATIAVDGAITISDVEAHPLSQATLSITNFVAGQDVLACNSDGNITCSWSGVSGVLTLSGSASLAIYEAKIESVTYNNTSENPVTTTRNIQLVTVDTGGTTNGGNNTSAAVNKGVDIVSINAPPVVTGFAGTTVYTEDVTAFVDSAIVLSDEENHTVSSALLSITNFVAAEDVLACNSDGNITCAWNAGSGVLTLSGVTTLANYEAKIESVTYNNSSQNPTTTTRNVRLDLTDTGGTLNGGDNTSTPVIHNISVTAVNDAPTAASATVATNEDVDYTFNSGIFSFNDVDGHSFTNLRIETLPVNGDLYDNGGIVASIPYLLAAADIATLTFKPDLNQSGVNYANFQFDVQDSSASNNISTGNYIITINVNTVNDRPSSANDSINAIEDTDYGFTAGDFVFNDNDGDNLLSVIIESLPAAGSVKYNGVAISGGQLPFVAADITQLAFRANTNANGSSYASFQFEVRDDSGMLDTSTGNYIMTVNVAAVNDEPTVGTNSNASVVELGSVTLNAGNLSSSDIEDADTSLTYIVTAVPVNGALRKGATILSNGGSFTQADINGGSVSYTQTGNAGNPVSDSFTFSLNDIAAVGPSGQIFTIDITLNSTPLISAGGTLNYTENDLATAISSVIISDTDNDQIASATVQITGNYQAGEDVLSFVSQNGISGVLSTGTMTLTGAASIANYQTALASVAYSNTSQNPVTLSRTVTYNVTDDFGLSSTGAIATVNVARANDAPTSNAGAINAVEDTDYAFSASDFVFNDIDGDNLVSVVIESLPVAGSLSYNGSSVTGGDLPFTATNITLLVFRSDVNGSGNNYATFQFEVKDDSLSNNTSTGNYQMTVNVSADNDVPTIDVNSNASVVELGSVALSTANLSSSDVEDANTSLLYTVTAVPGSGTMLRGASVLNLNDTFTQGDVNAGQISYNQTDNTGSPVSDSFGFSLQDSQGAGPVNQTFTIDITLNSIPIVTAGGLLNYSEGDSATIISAVTLSDADNDQIANATVQITGNFQSSEDTLGFVTQNGIAGLYNAGTLTLSGSSSVANYQAALASVTYSNSSQDPSELTRIVTYIATDAFGLSSTGSTASISVSKVNDVPVSVNNGGITLTASTSKTITSSDLSFSDIEDGPANLTYVIGGAPNAAPTQGTLFRSGVALVQSDTFTQKDIDDGLISYTAGAVANPDDFNFVVRDNNATPGVVNGQVFVITISTNAPPVIVAGGTLNYIENQSAQLVDSTIAITDSDNTDMQGATVQITGNYQSTEDTLGFVNQNGITGVYNSGTMTLSGNATIANYETALASITYVNSSDNPDTNPRTVTYRVRDAFGNNSSGSIATINVAAQNDAPSGANNTLSTPEDTSKPIVIADFGFNDPDSADSLQSVTIVAAPLAGSLDVSGTNVTDSTVVALADLSGNLVFTPAVNAFASSYASFTFRVNDGTALSAATYTMTIDVSAVNDAPTVTNNVQLAVIELGSSAISSALLRTDDVDDVALNLTYTVTTLPLYGDVRANGIALLLNSTFSQDDVNSGRLSYLNTVASQTSDSFGFRVEDVSNAGPAGLTFNISISQNAVPTITAGGVLNYTENDVATVIDSSIDIVDTDGDDIQAATVTISNNFQSSEDVLACPASLPGGIACNDSVSGTVTLSNISTMVNYETALAGITYLNSSEDPNINARTITYSVMDDFGNGSTGSTAVVNVAAQNDAPMAANNTVATVEDTPVAILAANFNFTDTDSADSLQSVTVVLAPAAGSLDITGTGVVSDGTVVPLADLSGNLVFTPALNAFGNPDPYTTFTFRVNDGTELSVATYTMTLNVSADNDVPTLDVNAGLTAKVNVLKTITSSELSSSDVEDTAANITYTVTTLPTQGSLSSISFTQQDILNGTVSYTPGPVSGNDSFIFDVDDQANAGPTAQTFSITISANDPPAITAGAILNYTENQTAQLIDTTISIADSDDALMKAASVQITGNFVNGEDVLACPAPVAGITCDNSVAGTLSFASATNNVIADYQTVLAGVTYFNNSDNPNVLQRTVTYTVTDDFGNVSSGGTALIDVSAQNDPPTSVNNTIATIEDTPVSIIAGDFNFADVDSADSLQSVTIVIAPLAGSLDVGGTAVVDNTVVALADLSGNLVFTPAANAFASSYATFSFRVNDGTALSAVTYTMTIDVSADNDVPVIDTNNLLNVTELNSAVIASALLSSSDIEDAAANITYTVTTVPAYGTLTANTFTQAQIDANAISYTNTSAGQIADSFIFDVQDSNGAGPTGITFNIGIGQNATPVIVAGAILNYAEDDAATVIDASIDITDADNDTMQSAVVSISNNFQASEDALGCPAVLPGGILCDASIAGTVSFSTITTMVNYETALAGVTYANSSQDPNIGTRTVSYQVSDSFGNTSLSNTATITVSRANDAPEALNGMVATVEDTAKTILAADFNFSDVDTADSLQSVTIVNAPAAGSLVVTGSGNVTDGTVVAVADLAGNLIYTPAANAFGNPDPYTTFSFRVNDGTVLSADTYTMNINVSADNDVPTLDVNTGINLQVNVNQVITVANLSSTDIEDGAGNITYTVTAGPTFGSLSGNSFTQQDILNGTVSYTAGAVAANDSFTFDVDDSAGAGPVARIFNIVISPNVAPIVTSAAILNYTENDAATAIDTALTVNDADGDNIQGAVVQISGNYQNAEDTLVFVNQNGISGVFNAGTLTLSGTATAENYQTALRSVAYSNSSENPNIGARTVSYIVSDQFSNSSMAVTASVNVVRANDAPTAANSSVTAQEDVPQAINAADFNFADVDSGDALESVIIVSLPASGQLRREGTAVTVGESIALVNLAGNLTFTSANNAFGTPYTTFTFRVHDGDAQSAISYTMTMNVDSVDDAPVAANNVLTAVEDIARAILASEFNFGDAGDGDALASVRITNLPLKGVLRVGAANVNANDDISLANLAGNFTYTSALNEFGAAYTSFSFRVNDGVQLSTASYTMLINVNAANDAPNITLTATPDATEVVAYSYAVTVIDVDDLNDGTALTWSLTGQPTGMTVSNTGVVNWTPPQNYVNDFGATAQFTVKVQDSGALSDSQLFSINVLTPDGDGDGIADYIDNCPTDSNAGQEDLDADNIGDICDADRDGDGIDNAYEDLYPGILDADDPTDAGNDPDNDGLTNLEEFQQGKDPTVDDAGPVITAPADMVVDATGYLTNVEIGEATAVDLIDGVTPVTYSIEREIDNVVVTGNAFVSGRYNIIWSAIDTVPNQTIEIQLLDIQPLANLSIDQLSGEGTSVTVSIMLSGNAPVYPVSFDYILTGTADDLDYNFASAVVSGDGVIGGGSIQINSGTTLTFTVDVNMDADIEGDETIIIDISNPVNAVLGVKPTHTITVVERNVAPDVNMQAMQLGSVITTAYQSSGDVQVSANASDINGDNLSYVWSTGSAELDAAINAGGLSIDDSLSFDPDVLTVGRAYLIDVVVSDDAASSASTHMSTYVYVKAAADTPVLSSFDDTDNDGITDDIDGFGDADNDGILDYLDSMNTPEIAVNQSVNLNAALYIQTDAGLSIKAGPIAVAAGKSGTLIVYDDLVNYGGVNVSPGQNTEDTFSNSGGYYNFELNGLTAAQPVARVVIPLQTLILPDAVYRKYWPDQGWVDYVIDDNNKISSAPGFYDACPAPGSELYEDGLIAFSYCIQLTIEDGGPNDLDGERNGRIIDPGGVGDKLEPVVDEEAKNTVVSDGGLINPWLLYLMFVAFYLRNRKLGRR